MIAPVSKAEIAAAASKRVIFAHQSVGNDILDGVRTLATDAGVPLNVVESREAPSDTTGIFHFKVGTNGVPLGKLEEFRNTLSQEQLANVDVAVVKLCYIDFNSNADAAQIATAYVQTIDELQQRHPQTVFAAMTAPLTTIQTGPKAWTPSATNSMPSFANASTNPACSTSLASRRAAVGNPPHSNTKGGRSMHWILA
jgi:hypothetical protein